IRGESEVPILILTAKDAESAKVAGLELGADDDVTKPFAMRELMSRLRALVRRAGMGARTESAELLRGGAVELDVARHEARVRGEEVPLPPKGFGLFEAFLRSKGRLLSREFNVEAVCAPDCYGIS